jgi:hypothetical protein
MQRDFNHRLRRLEAAAPPTNELASDVAFELLAAELDLLASAKSRLARNSYRVDHDGGPVGTLNEQGSSNAHL